jgi:hypothetical protein
VLHQSNECLSYSSCITPCHCNANGLLPACVLSCWWLGCGRTEASHHGITPACCCQRWLPVVALKQASSCCQCRLIAGVACVQPATPLQSHMECPPHPLAEFGPLGLGAFLLCSTAWQVPSPPVVPALVSCRPWLLMMHRMPHRLAVTVISPPLHTALSCSGP